LNELPHLQNYPQMLPYIGSKWGENKKILFLAESHYIPGVDIKSIYPEIDFRSKWYDLNESYFDGHDYLKDYINTRSVIEKSDDVHNSGFSSPLTIYYNIKEELKKILVRYKMKILFSLTSAFIIISKDHHLLKAKQFKIPLKMILLHLKH
jgi:hypothetical protein